MLGSVPSNTHMDDAVDLGSAKVSLQARKHELVRDAIWVAAIDLFAEKGFEETTVDHIVEAAGTSRRTFFRYFESKRDLMAQPVMTFGASFTKAIESCPIGSSRAELFHHVVVEVAQRTTSDSRMRKVMEIAAKYPAAREAQVSRVAELQDRLAEAFAERCDGKITAHALSGLTLSALSLTYRVWFSEGKRDLMSAVQHVLAEFSAVVCREGPKSPGKRSAR
jgi:AcrR family transcriptional regulator